MPGGSRSSHNVAMTSIGARGVRGQRLTVTFAAFVVTSDATLVIALLPQIGDSLSVSGSTAGLGVSFFALGYACFGPVLTHLVRGIAQSRVLRFNLIAFAAINVFTAGSTSLLMFLTMRLAAGAAAGLFMPAAAIAVVHVDPGAQPTRALSSVTIGASAAALAGVPLGDLIGSLAGWRWTFLILALQALICARLLRALKLSSTQDPPSPRHLNERVSSGRQVLLVTLLWATGSFTFFTYLARVMTLGFGVPPNGLPVVLVCFGCCGLIGVRCVGTAARRLGASAAVRIALGGVVASMVLVAVASSGGLHGTAGLAVACACYGVYGAATWSVMPLQQTRLLELGGDQARHLSFNASATYLGVAAGGFIGGRVTSQTNNPGRLCEVAALICTAALAATWSRNRRQPL